MGYGISILNGSSRILIDSDQGYPTLYEVSQTTYTSGTAYPSTTDLLFARPSSNSGTLWRNNLGVMTCSSGNIIVKQMRAVTGGGFTPATTGYGLNIYNSAGTTAIFSATSANYTKGLDIIGISTFGGLGTYSDWTMPSATYNLSTSKIYVLLNTTLVGGTDATNQYYEYLPAVGTYGTIRAHAYQTVIVYPSSVYTDLPSTNGNIMAIAYARE